MKQLNPPILLKQQIYTESVSVWEINGELIGITQNTDGKYLMYKLSVDEFKEWDSFSHITNGLDNCVKIGEKSEILKRDWRQQ